MTRLTAAAWMIENKSAQTGPEVLEKLQLKAEVTQVWARFGHVLYVTVIVSRVCSRKMHPRASHGESAHANTTMLHSRTRTAEM